MTRDDTTKDQAKIIETALGPMVRYLHKLQARMEKTGFVPSDAYFNAVARAYDGVQALWVSTHYIACGVTLGQTPAKKDAEDQEQPQ